MRSHYLENQLSLCCLTVQQWIIFFSNQGWFPWATHQLLLEMREILCFSYLLYIPTQSYSNFIFFYTNYFRIFLFRIWIGKDDWGGLWIRVREVHNIKWYQVYMATEYGPEKYINIHIYMARQDKQTTQVKSRTEGSDARERGAENASSATGCTFPRFSWMLCQELFYKDFIYILMRSYSRVMWSF